MVMTLVTENIASNKWYPQQNGKPLYPTPQAILRGAYGETNYKFIAEGPDTDFIRAAVVMPLGVPFSHLLDVPWVMSFRAPEWRMLIASCEDPVRWIELARASGCIAWQRGHAKTFTYKWEMPPLDEHKLKIRPPNSLGVTRIDGPGRSDRGTAKKNYDRQALVDDIRAGLMTQTEIGKKHGLSRIRVLGIAKEEGIRSRAPHHGLSNL